MKYVESTNGTTPLYIGVCRKERLGNHGNSDTTTTHGKHAHSLCLIFTDICCLSIPVIGSCVARSSVCHSPAICVPVCQRCIGLLTAPSSPVLGWQHVTMVTPSYMPCSSRQSSPARYQTWKSTCYSNTIIFQLLLLRYMFNNLESYLLEPIE